MPKPSDAAKVNAYAPLLARARECERIRHHLPNLLAVNFYKARRRLPRGGHAQRRLSATART